MSALAISVPVSTNPRVPAPKWVPRAEIGSKKLPVDSLAEARSLSGIPIHSIQEFIYKNATGRALPNVRKLAMAGDYKKIFDVVSVILERMYRGCAPSEARARFMETHTNVHSSAYARPIIDEQIRAGNHKEILKGVLGSAIEHCVEQDDEAILLEASNVESDDDILFDLSSSDSSDLYLK